MNPIPESYRAAIPYLNVSDGDAALDFYERGFGARIGLRLGRPDGKLAHAEVRVGEGLVMVRAEIPDLGFRSPQAVGGTPIQILVYVEDAQAIAERAEGAGAKVVRPVEEQFHGDVMATLEDPFGYVWLFATHVEDIAEDDLAQRSADYEPGQ
ncbi:MAG: VOC family protein [Actinobacteria bacterium]|nr:VOC family protein [Actinomycetota bacterium]